MTRRADKMSIKLKGAKKKKPEKDVRIRPSLP
jgi:hypothetical protein